MYMLFVCESCGHEAKIKQTGIGNCYRKMHQFSTIFLKIMYSVIQCSKNDGDLIQSHWQEKIDSD